MPIPKPNAKQDIYMNTAKTMPSPATVTKPPFCESSAGAPAVVDFTIPPVVVDEEEFVLLVAVDFAVPEALAEVDVALPLAVEFDEALPVALVPAEVSVLAVFPAFVDEDCVLVSYVRSYTRA